MKSIIMVLLFFIGAFCVGCSETGTKVNTNNTTGVKVEENVKIFYKEFSKYMHNLPDGEISSNVYLNTARLMEELSSNGIVFDNNDIIVLYAKYTAKESVFSEILDYNVLSINLEDFAAKLPLKEQYQSLINELNNIKNNQTVLLMLADKYSMFINHEYENVRNNIVDLSATLLLNLLPAVIPADEVKIGQIVELLYNLNEKTKLPATYEINSVDFNADELLKDAGLSSYNTFIAECSKIINDNEDVIPADEDLYTDTDFVENLYYTAIAENLLNAPEDYTLISNRVNNRVVDLLRVLKSNGAEMPGFSSAADKKELLTGLVVKYVSDNGITYTEFNVEKSVFETNTINKIFLEGSFGKKLIDEWNKIVQPEEPQDEAANIITNETINYYHNQLIQKIENAPYLSTQKSKNRVAEFLEKLQEAGAEIPDMSATDKHALLIDKAADFLKTNNYNYSHFNVSKDEFNAGIIKELFETDKSKITAFIKEWNDIVKNDSPVIEDEDKINGINQVENYLPAKFLSNLSGYPGAEKRTVRSENRALEFYQTMKQKGFNEPDYNKLLSGEDIKYAALVSDYLNVKNITYSNFDKSKDEFKTEILDVLFPQELDEAAKKLLADWNKLVTGETGGSEGTDGTKIAPDESSLPQAPAKEEGYYNSGFSEIYWTLDYVFDIVKGDRGYSVTAYNRVEDLIQAVKTNGGQLPDKTNASKLSENLTQILGNYLKSWGFTYKHLNLSKDDFKTNVIDVIFTTHKDEGDKLVTEWNKAFN